MSPALSAQDAQLYRVVTDTAPVTIADVVAIMQQIDLLLPANDGLKWFNRLYLTVTQQVDLNPPGGAWQSPAWMVRLDTVFAGLYFSAIANFLDGATLPSSWSALFQARYRVGIDRIQFAVAGMNAHINHDLALALLTTNADQGVEPAASSPEYADYQAINALLEGVMPAALTMLAADTLGVLAEDTGKVGRLLAFWDICKARTAAWDFADTLRDLPLGRGALLAAQDGITGALGRAILVIA